MDIFNTKPNSQCYAWDVVDAFKTEINKDDGVHKFFKILKNVALIAIAILTAVGSTIYLSSLNSAAALLGTVTSLTVLTKIFSSICSVKEDFTSPSTGWVDFIYDILNLSVDSCLIAGLGSGFQAPLFIKASTVFFYGVDTKNSVEKLDKQTDEKIVSFRNKCSRAAWISPLTLGLIQHPLKSTEDPSEMKNIYMMKTLKNTIGLALGILALVGALYGVTLLSKLAILVISTFTTSLSLATKVYADVTSHKMTLINAKRGLEVA